MADDHTALAVARVDQSRQGHIQFVNGWLVQGVDVHRFNMRQWRCVFGVAGDSLFPALSGRGACSRFVQIVGTSYAAESIVAEQHDRRNPSQGSGISRSVRTGQRRFTPKDSANG
jgi:hypothetical protein